MTKTLIAAASMAVARAYGNDDPIRALAGSKLYICATVQNTNLDATAFAALTWVQVFGVGSLGETGMKTNILTYNEWESDVAQKVKGISNAGDPSLEVARSATDPGQILLRTAAASKDNYAIKIVRNDQPAGGSNPTTIYNRGLISGPRRPNGKTEDFDLEIFDFALNQKEVVVPAA